MPHFLSWRLREYGYSARLIDTAHEVNANMPIHVVHKVADALNAQGRVIKGARILVLGAAYEADVHDTRESPSLTIMQNLLARGADLRFCDPWVPTVPLGDAVLETWNGRPGRSRRRICVVMLTPHRSFREDRHWERARLVVDTRNVVPTGPMVWSI